MVATKYKKKQNQNQEDLRKEIGAKKLTYVGGDIYKEEGAAVKEARETRNKYYVGSATGGGEVTKEEYDTQLKEKKKQAEGLRATVTPEDLASTVQPQQPTQVAPEVKPGEELRLDQKAAALPLKPVVAVGNAITGILERVTGKTFDRTTAEELVKTPQGEALGLATGAVALSLTGAYAYETYLGSLSAQELIGVVSEQSLPTAMKVPALNTLTKITTGKILGLTAVGSVPRILRKDTKQAIQGQNAVIANILEDVTKGKPLSQAQQELNQVEGNINQLAGAMHLWSKLDLTHWLGNGRDDEGDLENVRQNLEDARRDVISGATTYAQSQLLEQKQGGLFQQ